MTDRELEAKYATIKGSMTIRELKNALDKFGPEYDDIVVFNYQDEMYVTLDGIEPDCYDGEIQHLVTYFDLDPETIAKYSK